ncbi:hypothetical protein HanRHA438_Chr00c07g0846961 [Helianthus annuus]|nr:hypothetical protein HanRHA438_Chr00c07g0846961 [Helianthus annuus]
MVCSGRYDPIKESLKVVSGDGDSTMAGIKETVTKVVKEAVRKSVRVKDAVCDKLTRSAGQSEGPGFDLKIQRHELVNPFVKLALNTGKTTNYSIPNDASYQITSEFQFSTLVMETIAHLNNELADKGIHLKEERIIDETIDESKGAVEFKGLIHPDDFRRLSNIIARKYFLFDCEDSMFAFYEHVKDHYQLGNCFGTCVEFCFEKPILDALNSRLVKYQGCKIVNFFNFLSG